MNTQAESDRDTEESGPANAITPGELISYIRTSARRHARVGLIVAISILVPGLTVAAFIPVKYEANSRIFVDETAAKTEALSTPNRALPNLDPVSGTYELLMQKSTLVSLVKETGLLENWEANRSAPLRAKDKFMALISGQPTVKEKTEALADMLANNIALVKEKNLVRIRVTWTDRVFTLKLARLAQNKFIELVRARETGAFSSAISILEEETKRAEEAIGPALNEAVKARETAIAKAERGGLDAPPAAPAGSAAPAGPPVRRSVAVAPAASVAPNRDAVEPTAQIASAKLAELAARIKAVEEPWRRRQVELSSRLSELRVVYGEEHPAIVQQKEQVAAASVPPPELVELNKTRAELLDAIKRAPAASTAQDSGERQTIVRVQGSARPAAVRLTLENGKPKDLDDDPVVATAKAGLHRAIEKYNQLTERLESARLQFITAQAAFNSRLVVTGNPQLPRKPIKPLPTIISIAAVVAAALFGLLAGALRELASGKIHELWQVKPLGLKPLGEVWIERRLEP